MARRRRWADASWTAGALLLPASTGISASLPRYLVVVYPAFYALEEMLRGRPVLRWIWWIVSAALLLDMGDTENCLHCGTRFPERTRISVSVATAEFKPERDGTRLVFTEQGAFLDGHEIPARREQGMGSLLDSLGQWLQSSESDGG